MSDSCLHVQQTALVDRFFPLVSDPTSRKASVLSQHVEVMGWQDDRHGVVLSLASTWVDEDLSKYIGKGFGPKNFGLLGGI